MARAMERRCIMPPEKPRTMLIGAIGELEFFEQGVGAARRARLRRSPK